MGFLDYVTQNTAWKYPYKLITGDYHTGAWGAPDLGWTEDVQKIIAPNKAYASTGGSNLVGSSDQQSSASTTDYSTQMSTQNMSVDPSNPYNRDQIEGASTDQGWGNTPTGDVPTGDNGGQPSGPSPEDKVRQGIESGFGEYFNALDRMAGLIPEQGQTMRSEVNTLYGNQMGQINRAGQAQQRKMNQYETEARQNKKTSLRDMYENVRNLLQAGQTYLGALGAGDSSAVGRYGAAITKSANQNAASIMNQANKIYNDINMKRAEIDQTVQDELANLDNWKASKLSEISQWVSGQKQQIESLRASGQLQKAEAIRDLNTQIMNVALDRIARLDQEASNFRQGLSEWAMSRSESLKQLQQNLQAMGQYNMPGYQMSPISGQMQRTPQGVNSLYGYGVRDEEEQNQLI